MLCVVPPTDRRALSGGSSEISEFDDFPITKYLWIFLKKTGK